MSTEEYELNIKNLFDGMSHIKLGLFYDGVDPTRYSQVVRELAFKKVSAILVVFNLSLPSTSRDCRTADRHLNCRMTCCGRYDDGARAQPRLCGVTLHSHYRIVHDSHYRYAEK